MENEIIKKEPGARFAFASFVVFVLELFGTAFLVYAVTMQAYTGNGIAVPLGLLCAIWISGPITGGHCNPAVTLAVFIIRWRDFCRNLYWLALYTAAQFTGGIVGAWFALMSTKPLDKKQDPSTIPVLAP